MFCLSKVCLVLVASSLLAVGACSSGTSKLAARDDAAAGEGGGGVGSPERGGGDGGAFSSGDGGALSAGDGGALSAGDGGAANGGTGGAADSGSDPYFSNVVLLMHFDGTNAATTFTDVKGHTVTPHGAAQLATMTSVFGGSSGVFDGSSSWLSLPGSDDWNFGAQDFAVELFVSFNGGVAGQGQIPTVVSHWGPAVGGQSWELLYNHSWTSTLDGADYHGTLTDVLSTTGANEVFPLFPWVPDAATWYHLAFTRQGSFLRYFVNGALAKSFDLGTLQSYTQADAVNWTAQGAISGDVALHASAGPLAIATGIGSDGNAFAPTYFSGNIDELRITKGVARYTEAFTRPAAPFPDN